MKSYFADNVNKYSQIYYDFEFFFINVIVATQ